MEALFNLLWQGLGAYILGLLLGWFTVPAV